MVSDIDLDSDFSVLVSGCSFVAGRRSYSFTRMKIFGFLSHGVMTYDYSGRMVPKFFRCVCETKIQFR